MKGIQTDQSLARVQALMTQETTAYAAHDYFSHVQSYSSLRRSRTCHVEQPSTPPVDASCRFLMTKWCHSLCDFCKYPREISVMTMSCVDRYAASESGFQILFDRDRYQLAVMAALYLVAKVHSTEALDPESVAKLSRGKHTKTDIEDMELELLVGLRWRVHPPTPWAIAQELLNLVPVNQMNQESEEQIMELTRLQLEIAVCNYDLSLNRPSVLAFGAILNAMESLDASVALQFETMVSQILGTRVDELRAIRRRLLKVVSEDSSSEPKFAVLTQRFNRSIVAGLSKEKNISSSSCVNSSPRCVSASIP